MTSFCMFREDEFSPIYESTYNFNTGTILRVPDTKFKYIVPSYFSTDFDTPVNFGIRLDRAFYIRALQLTRGLVAFNFYDVGVTVLSKDGIFVLLKEGLQLKYFEGTKDCAENLFNYEKIYVGTYKTVVTQFDVPMNRSLLVVDKYGYCVTNLGIVSTNLTVGCDRDILLGLNCIKTWRDGFDGLAFIGVNEFAPYKISYPFIDIIR